MFNYKFDVVQSRIPPYCKFYDTVKTLLRSSTVPEAINLIKRLRQVAIVGCEIKVQKGYIRKPLRVAQ